ncbi:MAG: hypothetical protein FWE74_04925 [Oscillospiraceae bacterium]|nr:hypothetical protein [Oscillospiraceae bacterium]
MKNKLFTVLLIMVLFLTSCAGKAREKPVLERERPGTVTEEATLAAASTLQHEHRRTVHFNDMVYERPDVNEILESIRGLTEELKSAPDFDTVLLLELQLHEAAEHFYTMNSLALIRNDLDMFDDYYEIEYRFMREADIDIKLAIAQFNRELTEGVFAGEYRKHAGEHYYASLLRSLLFECESVTDYKKELADLYIDYEAMFFSLAVDYERYELTYNDVLYAQWLGMDFLMEKYLEQYLSLYVEMYARIIELYKLMAYELGFDCAAEMLYLLQFNRDYSPDDARIMFNNIKKYLVPLTPLLTGYEENPGVFKLKAVMEVMPEVLGGLDEELAGVWDFMIRYGVYDFEPLPEKSVSGYMVNLYAYDTPFIYTYWNHDFSGVYTILHEFGHFYNDWLRLAPDNFDYGILDLDASEFYAEGIAVLLREYYSAFTDEPVVAQRFIMFNSVYNAIIVQSMFEEFQLRAFELEDVSADTLGILYAQLFLEYGFEDDFMGMPLDANVPYHDWLRISHFFYLPFYTVSYVTSSIAAMQLWEIAAEDAGAAADIYLNMIRQTQDKSFTELLESVSLRPVREPEVLHSIAEQVKRYYAN